MAEHTGIERCDATFNPWWGCERVSPACAHCYADTLARRYGFGDTWGAGHGFRFFGDKHWNDPLKWARLLPAKLGRRPRVFCASMADVFEERHELDEHRDRLWETIVDTPELDWLILTKRPEFARDWLRDWYFEWTSEDPSVGIFGGPMPLPNVWLGVSIENARHTWRADVLREIPAAVRFISAEPLLGSLFDSPREGAGDVLPTTDHDNGGGERALESSSEKRGRRPLDLTRIDWIIAGGESGPHARPSHPDWFRELRDACIEQYGMDARAETRGPAFFFKQWGEWAPGDDEDIRSGEWHHDGSFVDACLCSEGTVHVVRAGKKANGRMLDGREWSEFPVSAAVLA